MHDNFHPPRATTDEFHDQCLLGVGNLALLISLAAAKNQIDRPSPAIVNPPKLAQFPAMPSSVSDMPIPFAKDPAAEWSAYLANLRRSMARPEHLCTGTWQGYYSYYGLTSRFESPMTDVRFRTLPDEEDGRVEARGVDAIGTFVFTGTMHDHGQLSGLKAYPTHSVRWDSSMTPFGLYGFWTMLGGGTAELSGAVWLWKKEWTDD
jgi:hypothetical protein